MTPRAALVRMTANGLHRTGLLRPFSIAAGYAARGGSFQVLTYHRVNDADDPFFAALPTGVFEAHMRWVAGACCVLPLETLVARARDGRVPRNAVAITFDDGYRDTFTHATPILNRYGLTATVFVSTGFVGTTEVPWFDRVAHAFKHARAGSIVTPWHETVALTDTDARLLALDRALAHLKAQPDDDRRRQVERLVDALGAGRAPRAMLSWDEIHALSRLGFDIGGHTVSHPILSRMRPDGARAEIVLSRRAIEAALGRPPLAFAYPNGGADDYTPATVDIVRDAGFTCAVTTQFGLNTGATSPFELRRGGPWEYHLPTFALKLAGYRLAGQV